MQQRGSQIKNIPKLRFPEFRDEWVNKHLNKITKKLWIGLVTTMTVNYSDRGVRLIRNSNIRENRIDDPNPIYLEDTFANQFKNRSLRIGDVVTVHTGDVGTSAIIDKRFDGAQGFATLNTRVNTDILNNQYLCLFFNTYKYKKWALRFSTGDGRNNLNIYDFVKSSIPLTSLKEQQKIADFLTAVDEKITAMQKKVDLLKRYQKGIMQQIFTQQIRFKDENGNDFPDWEENKLKEIANIVGGGTPDTSKAEFWNGNIFWLTPTEVKTKYVSASKRTITELGLKNSSAKILPVNTIIFTSRATVGDVAVAQVPLVTNQGFQSLVVNKDNNNEFLYYWVIFNKSEFLKKSSGSTFPEISKSEMEKINISLPIKEEQQKIAGFLTIIDDKIQHEERKLEQAKKFKKSLLQQMFV